MTRKLVSILVLLLAMSVAGCSKAPAPPKAEPPASAPVRQIEPMKQEQKLTAIGEGFPIEVPVPDGEVLRGQSQGDAWDYEVVVEANQDALVTWYLDAYQGRSWEVVEKKEVTGLTGERGTEITLRKGYAASRVTITPQGDSSLATVILGVGTDVLQTQ